MADGDGGGRWCPVHGAPTGQNERRTQAFECIKCREHNHHVGGRRKAQPKLEPRIEEMDQYTYVGSFNVADFTRYMDRILHDPIRLAAAMTDARRPSGVDRSRFSIAVRGSCKEPMLNAAPDSIRKGMLLEAPKNKVPKGKPFRYLLVKPNHFKVAHMAGGWHSREWTVFTLKYTKGLVIVTNRGDETRVFQGWKAMQKAIVDSGWEIVR